MDQQGGGVADDPPTLAVVADTVKEKAKARLLNNLAKPSDGRDYSWVEWDQMTFNDKGRTFRGALAHPP